MIVFGGDNTDNKMLYVLNTTNFNWYEPNNSGTQPSMKRSGHTANVIGKYMVIAFGSGPNFNFEYKEKGEADVLLLDVSNSLNYVWTDHFSPDAVIPPQSSSPQPSPPQLNITIKIIQRIIVGVVVGVLGIICIIPFGIFFFIKRRNILLHENALPIPGNSENVPSG